MPTHAARLSDRQLKTVKPIGKDFVLSDGDGLQLRVRASGSMMWNFNYREPLTRSRVNMAFGPYPPATRLPRKQLWGSAPKNRLTKLVNSVSHHENRKLQQQ